MKRPSSSRSFGRRLVTISALSGLVVLAAACGSDSNSGGGGFGGPPAAVDDNSDNGSNGSDNGSDNGSSDTAAPDAGDNGLGDVSIPGNIPGLSDECTSVYQAFLSAMSGVGSGTNADMAGLGDAFASLESKVPDDLRDDVRVLADGYRQLGEVMQQYDGDYAKMAADPAAAEKLAFLDSEEFTSASDAISNYFDETCGTGS